jgi:hypothetical protein
MTPKEKAIELVYKFYWRETHLTCSITDAKQCALVSVDEIIKYVLPRYQDFTFALYWEEVKYEIGKI